MRHAAETLETARRPVRGAGRLRAPDARPAAASTPRPPRRAASQVIIAGAGGAAHLAGDDRVQDRCCPCSACRSSRRRSRGWTRCSRSCRCRPGVPVGTLAIGRAGAVNAALLAASILRVKTRSRERLAPLPRPAQTAAAGPPGSARGRLARDRRRPRRRSARADARAGRYPARRSLPRSSTPRRRRRPGTSASSSSVRTTTPTRLERFADGADVVTYEFENVPVGPRAPRVGAGFPPPGRSRRPRTGWPRSGCSSARIPLPRYAGGSPDELEAVVALGSRDPEDPPARLRRQGPDRHACAGSRPGTRSAPGRRPRGAWSRFDRELSVLAVRGHGARRRFYPLVQNVHRDGILRRRVRPQPNASQARGRGVRTQILDELDYVGVLALELFEVGGTLLANEIAPRVHNSGHWTIEGAETSQFENHLRAILGLPLGSTASRRARWST